MNDGKTNVQFISQANHRPEDAISLGENVLQYTIKCAIDSPADLWVGINEPASNGFILAAGESVTITDQRVYLDRDRLYLKFDPAMSGGKAQVIIINDLMKEHSC